jgi:hypothetical protein
VDLDDGRLLERFPFANAGLEERVKWIPGNRVAMLTNASTPASELWIYDAETGKVVGYSTFETNYMNEIVLTRDKTKLYIGGGGRIDRRMLVEVPIRD